MCVLMRLYLPVEEVQMVAVHLGPAASQQDKTHLAAIALTLMTTDDRG